jgi:hypothetical protein
MIVAVAFHATQDAGGAPVKAHPVSEAGTSGRAALTRLRSPSPRASKGVWEIKFAAGRDTIILNGTVEGHGHYSILGSTLTFKPKGTCHSPGKYKFKLTGNKLRFTKISDSCPSARPNILQRTWTKV